MNNKEDYYFFREFIKYVNEYKEENIDFFL